MKSNYLYQTDNLKSSNLVFKLHERTVRTPSDFFLTDSSTFLIGRLELPLVEVRMLMVLLIGMAVWQSPDY